MEEALGPVSGTQSVAAGGIAPATGDRRAGGRGFVSAGGAGAPGGGTSSVGVSIADSAVRALPNGLGGGGRGDELAGATATLAGC